MKTFDPTQFTEPASDAGGRSSMPASVAQVEELLVEAQCAPVRIGSEAQFGKFESTPGGARVRTSDDGKATHVEFPRHGSDLWSKLAQSGGVAYGLDVGRPGQSDKTGVVEIEVAPDGSRKVLRSAVM